MSALIRELGLVLLDRVRWWHFRLAIKLGRHEEAAAVYTLMQREAVLTRLAILEHERTRGR